MTYKPAQLYKVNFAMLLGVQGMFTLTLVAQLMLQGTLTLVSISFQFLVYKDLIYFQLDSNITGFGPKLKH